ncbi:MAG TPA: Ig-like domain-containing protein, partial [Ilumatobacteraceae bacterium]
MASNLFARRRVGVGFLAAVFLAGGTSSIVASMPAQAAVVPNPVLSITVTPPNPRAIDPVRTDVQWCVPDSTAAGDTFEIALPAELTGLPSGFPLRDPNGLLVATATIVGTPAVATFTFTDYVDTHVNVCGTAFFESSLSDTVVPGTHVTLTFVVNHLNSFTPSIDVQPGTTTIGRGSARKGAYFNDPNDECRTVATACLGWYIESQVGPFQSVTIDDAAAAGTTFECSRVTVL